MRVAGGDWSRITQPSRPMITIGATNTRARLRSSRRNRSAMRRLMARVRRRFTCRPSCLGLVSAEAQERLFDVLRARLLADLRAGAAGEHLAVEHQQQLVAAIRLVHDVAAHDKSRPLGR